MNIITKYKDYLKLLESKYSENFLRNNRNGLDFYLIDEDIYDAVKVVENFPIEKYNNIKTKLKFNNNFLEVYPYWKDKKLLESFLFFYLFKNTSDDVEHGKVAIFSLIEQDIYDIEHDNYYLLKF